MASFSSFFESVTGYPPFPYQRRLAETVWPELVDVPTGLGKTAAVVLAWLWKRNQGDALTGRRLVYVLPMRSLVDQTATAARFWAERAAAFFARPEARVHILMGGERAEDWELAPEQEALIVGTQDMILSRALNRGYGMSRYRWPVSFGLLHNDAIWVMDETQLMGVAVETSAQLEGLRRSLGTIIPSRALWMSATLGRRQIDTVDNPRPNSNRTICSLEDDDRSHEVVRRRLGARKPLTRFEGLPRHQGDDDARARECADLALELTVARPGLTLVILNRVARAQEVVAALRASAPPGLPIALVHSRFREDDRRRQEKLLFDGAETRIVVATQAVEAGIDVSAKTLVTELADWPAMVQRFGRCNRRGELVDAEVVWLDPGPETPEAKEALPYSPDSILATRNILLQLEEVGPEALSSIAYESPDLIRPVLRRRDLLDLFDTTPDLLGEDIDVGRFVRDGDDLDVQVFWRDFAGEPDPGLAEPSRGEICRVSLSGFRSFADRLRRDPSNRGRAFVWEAMERRFIPFERPCPGQRVLLPRATGGYDDLLGWTGRFEDVPTISQSVPNPSAADDEPSFDHLSGDPDTQIDRWVALDEHLVHVRDEARRIAAALLLPEDLAKALIEAAAWHDVGKVHPEFQRRLIEPVVGLPNLAPPRSDVWAKSGHRRRCPGARPGFRHEFASALAWLELCRDGRIQHDLLNEPELDAEFLVAYLVASHHGKVRLSIRSSPDEQRPLEPDRLFARGVWHGEELASCTIPDDRLIPPVTMNLEPIRLGEGSWLERALRLRDAPCLGPFRLAFLEALVRIADWRASAMERGADPGATT